MASLRRLGKYARVLIFVGLVATGMIRSASATTDEAAYGSYYGSSHGTRLSFRYTNKGIEDVRVNGSLVSKGVVELGEEGAFDLTNRYFFEIVKSDGTVKVWFSVLFDDKEEVRAATALYSLVRKGPKDFSVLKANGFVLRFKKCKNC
jgi:hypothetical protein